MGRVIIVSNRVGSLSSVKASEGGLATALRVALAKREAVWLGWSGTITEDEPGPTRLQRDGRLTRALVDLKRTDYEHYYAGFSNRLIWPLFHYRIGLADFHREDYAGYRRVTELFADRLAAIAQPDDLIWVHDYHLFPLAQALRQRGLDQPIGFFLHVPFPAPEILTTLPVHRELVRGMFEYDLVGFQTDRDLQAFTDYVEREAGGTMSSDGVATAFGRTIRAGIFPIGVDGDAIAARAERALADPRHNQLYDSLSGRQLVIGVDRLDYTKGLLRRLEAVEHLFDTHPDYRRAVVVLQIAPPTRGDVPEYQQIRAELDGRVGRINGRFGEPDLLPVRYLNRHFSQDRLFGFYRIASVGMVTPLRDGMNLVAKEFVASQDADDPGVLVLSRFAGAARQLDAALIVNPYDIDGMAQALDRALRMKLEERRERHKVLIQAVRGYDIRHWWNSFIETLHQAASARAASRQLSLTPTEAD